MKLLVMATVTVTVTETKKKNNIQLINLLKKTLKTFSRFFCLYMETKKLTKYNSFQIKPYIHLTYRTIKLHSPLLTNKYLKNHK